MLRRLIPVLAVALWTAAPATAATFLDRAYGTPSTGLSARSRALGGAGAALAGGAFSLVDNPATLVFGRGSRADLTGSLMRASENRYVPLFDTFDSYVDDAAIAVNDNLYGSFQGGVVVDRAATRHVILAAGVFDRYDPRYDYRDERRTTATSDQLVAERFIRTRGVLRAASVGAAVPLPHGLGVGLALNGYFGTFEDRDALVPHTGTVSGRVVETERELRGFTVTLGGAWRVNERVDLGLAWESRPKLRDEYVVREDGVVTSAAGARDDLRLPYRLQAGMAYRPRNTFRTTFVMDGVFEPWSDAEDPWVPAQSLQDAWDVRFGLEHMYLDAVPGRIGFRFARPYASREADRATFTFGAGFNAGRWALDVSTEVGKAISRQTPLWPRDEQPAAVGAGMDRVEDTLVEVHLGARLDF